MDISEVYIKMCDCKEMQFFLIKKKYRNAVVGDWFARNTHGKWYREIQTSNMVDLMEWARNSLEERKEIPEKHWNKILRNTIWLPRQDQLQEMMIEKNRMTDLKNRFNSFISYIGWHNGDGTYNNEEIKFASFEQLWLAFYMHEKHGKVWDGKKWAKVVGNAT